MRTIQTVLKTSAAMLRSSAGLFASAALLLALAGCQRIELQGEGQQGTSEQGTSEQGATEQGAVEFSAEEFELTASIAEEQDRTKFSLDEDANRYLQPRWAVGDIVAPWDASGNTYGLTVKSVTSGGRSATMGLITSGTGKGSKTTVSSGTKLYLVSFPGVTASNVSSKTLTITLNAQTSDAIPLMASGTVGSGGRMPVIFDRAGTVLSLKNITNLKASTTYTRLGVSGCGNQIQFAIGSSGEIQASYPSSTGNALKTVSATTTSSGTLAGPLYIVVPPASSATVSPFLCTDAENTVSSINLSSCTLQAGRHYFVDNASFIFRYGSASVSSTDGRTSCGWVQLWEGGPKWAEFNVGATISSYGSLESGTDATTGNVAYYNTANVGGLYAWGTPGANGRKTTWDSDVTTGTKDVATELWGSNWQEPTSTQLNALKNANNCVWTWCDGSTTRYVSGCTLAGYKVSGKGGTAYANNSIFLPATGFFNYISNSMAVISADSYGYYWSSTPYGSDKAYILEIRSGYSSVYEDTPRKCGMSVRAVLSAQAE